MKAYITSPIQAIKATAGKFTKVKYQKKNGKIQTYTVRTGVRKYVSGVGKASVPNSVTVYSVTTGNTGYKTFLEQGIVSVSCGKFKWKF